MPASLGDPVCSPEPLSSFAELRHIDSRWGILHGAEQFLIGFPLPIEDDQLQRAKAALNQQGGWLSSYVDGALLCIGPPRAAQAVRKISTLQWLVCVCHITDQ